MADSTSLQKVVAPFLENVRVVDDNLLMGEKVADGTPYATVFVASTSELIAFAKKLEGIQDNVIAPIFFSSDSTLRKNFYFYITADFKQGDIAATAAKAAIEANDQYARKVVVPTGEIGQALEWGLKLDVHSRIESAGLIHELHGFLRDSSLTPLMGDTAATKLTDYLIDYIAAGETGSSVSKKRKRKGAGQIESHQSHALASTFLGGVHFSGFRAHPAQTSFEFGRVNLIMGNNGAGKTSLLELIELLYCGNTFRGRSRSRPVYSISATLNNGDIIETSSETPSEVFRDRNLSWYGRFDLQLSTLHDSFSRFNFLNSDAAFSLAMEDSTSRVTEALERLISGEQTSELWSRIRRVSDEIPRQVKAIKGAVSKSREVVQEIEAGIARESERPQESDGLFQLLRENLHSAMWREPPTDKHVVEQSTLPSLRDVYAKLVQLGSSFPSYSFQIIRDQIAELPRVERDLPRLHEIRKEWGETRKRLSDLTNSLETAEKTVKEVGELQLYYETGFIDVLTQRTQLLNRLEELDVMLGGISLTQDQERDLLSHASNIRISTYLEELSQQVSSGEVRVTTLEESLLQRESALGEIRALNLQLRHLGEKILHSDDPASSCPLCAAEYKSPAELLERIATHHARTASSEISIERQALDDTREKLARTRRVVKAMRSVADFAEREGVNDDNQFVAHAVKSLRDHLELRKTVTGELATADEKIRSFEQHGYTLKRCTQLVERIFAGRDNFNGEALQLALAQVTKTFEEASSQRAGISARVSPMVSEANAILANVGMESLLDLGDLSNRIGELTQRAEHLRSAAQFITEIGMNLDLEGTADPNAVEVALAKSIEVAARVNGAIKAEMDAATHLSSLRTRLAEKQEEAAKLTKRLAAARSILRAMQHMSERFSMEKLTENFARTVEGDMAEIFQRIHTPNEYEVKITSNRFLRGRSTGEPRSLEEISTGQRAAFALSAFLALNRACTKAPPALLLDDPIAHVDDLNSLAFLDFLRAIAIEGRRQVFFATADDRIAAMFRCKFAFLGSDYREIPLVRN